MKTLAETLKERGYVHQISAENLAEITDPSGGQKRGVYIGIDPSADSLHVGSLMGLLVLRHFLDHGHKVVILTGGGTGMIGDPGGKSEERNLLDEETVQRNASAVARQIRQVFGRNDFIEENNVKWLSKLSLLAFLRDVGKHFTVNAMIKKDIVSERLKKESAISYTEFSYSLLQAYDFAYLFDTHGVDIQIGGSDQWSNIIAGVDYIRRTRGKEAFALTFPLLVNKSTGKKFGKTEGGAVWLDSAKTSVFDFYQFWFNIDDDMVEECLLKMTLLSVEEIDAVMVMQKRDKSERHAQRLLARSVTALVHGLDEAERAEAVSSVLFGGASIADLKESERQQLRKSAPTADIVLGTSISDALLSTRLAKSKREVKQFLKAKAVLLNGRIIDDDSYLIGKEDFFGGFAILKRGKKNLCVLVQS